MKEVNKEVQAQSGPMFTPISSVIQVQNLPQLSICSAI